MKAILPIILLAVSGNVLAAQAKSGEAKLFNCMEKETFAINADCLSDNIESNLVFRKTEQAIIEKADDTSDRAMSTVTFYPKAMSIEVVAHRDAYLANNRQ